MYFHYLSIQISIVLCAFVSFNIVLSPWMLQLIIEYKLVCPRKLELDLWHMPHGIVLLANLKNNDNCYLLFKQSSSHHSHATSCASLSLSSSAHNLHAVTKSLHSETFYAKNQLLAKNSISINKRNSPKGASTSSRVLYLAPSTNGPTPLLALLLISPRDALLATCAWLPSHLFEELSS